MRKPFLERYWSFVEKSDGCWTWTGPKDQKGYGIIANDAGKSVRSHREAWRMVHGDIPNGLFVCHRCDNPSCVNPDHLWLGTNKENSDDRDRKGRWRGVHGEASPNAKLTDANVVSILTLLGEGQSKRSIAKIFGVDEVKIRHIAKGTSWAHVPRIAAAIREGD